MESDSNGSDDDVSANTNNSTIEAKRRKIENDGNSRRLPNSNINSNRSITRLRRSLTDSDIELDNAASAMSPAVRALAETSTQRRTRNRIFTQNSAPIIDLVSADVGGNGASFQNYSSRTTVDHLPDEILEEIFCRLPIIDLLHYCSLASRRFHRIIFDINYLRWKKLYARYLRNDADAVRRVNVDLRLELTGDGNRSIGVRELIKYMSDVQLLIDHEAREALRRLSHHRQFNSALEILKKLSTEEPTTTTESACVKKKNSEEINLGGLVSVLILISDGVDSISKIIDILTAQPSYCKIIYWVEYFYCLLTLLRLYSHLSLLVDDRLHYQLQYAIYLFENDGSKSYEELATKAGRQNSVAGQTSLDQYVGRRDRLPTYEQYRIIGHDLKPNDYVRIIAFAGTGKTTTLIEYCRARPSKNFLIIFYNKDVCVDAEARFPKNASCRTIHSLAYAQEAWRYKAANKLGFNLKLTEIINVCPDFKGLGRYVRAELVKQTLTNYCSSDREDITTICVPETYRVKDDDGYGGYVKREIDFDLKLKIVEQAEKVWAVMRDLRDRNVLMTYDGYLKLYQLNKPIIRCDKRGQIYHAILVDEAQDCNPAVLDIVKRQVHLPKILVGDGYQQIYSFRGAVNALESIPSTKTFYLTQSFRFGPEIAYVANAWMRTVLGERKKFLIGSAKPSRLDGHVDGQLAIICRTNFSVFNEAATIAEREQRQCLAMGSARQPYDFEPLEAIYYLYLSDRSRGGDVAKPKHYYITMFKTFADARDHAEKTNDKELSCRIKIVERYKLNTPTRIRSIKSCLVGDPKLANFVVTTAHKSKGLEFKNVCMANDFADLDDSHREQADDGDEFNLIYVAMTRAINSLILNETTLRALVNRLGPVFFGPRFGNVGEEVTCTICLRNRPATEGTLENKTVATTFVGRVVKSNESRFCKVCVEQIIASRSWELQFDDGDTGLLMESRKMSCFQFNLPLLG